MISNSIKTYFLALLFCLFSLQVLSINEDYQINQHWETDNHEYHYVGQYRGEQTHFQQSVSEIIKSIHVIVTFQNEKTFRVKILDNDKARWEIPERAPFPHFESSQTYIPKDDSCCSIKVEESPFAIIITRKENEEVLFDTRNKNFIYSNLYIELTTSLPTEYVYGYGERNFQFKLTPGIYTIWGRDDPKILEDGKGGSNTYGHHPVGLIRDKQGDFFLTLMRNSNAMDVIVKQGPELTYKMVGGVVDLVFFVGDEYPDTVLNAYHTYLGKFTMMPFWSMGYHQSKWGYRNHGLMLDVVNGYNNNNIPLDVIWSDIDYMIDKEIFTIDDSRYPLESMKELTTKYKKKWVPIIDPGVKQLHARGPGAEVGIQRDIFIKSVHGGDLIGSVWPGQVYFPDFFNPHADQYWSDMLDVLYQKVPFAGIWLDMNEIANFVDGEINRWDQCIYDQIPYTPGGRQLKRKTVSLDAVHHGNVIEYDAHGLFSLMENEATHKFLQTKSKLPFILTRGSSMGLGKFSSHWTGDNGAYWSYLQISIPGNFNFQIFGIPFVGADICGFMDNTNAELCARWTQVGALYPFARNHHELESRSQEPWTFNEQNRGVNVLETTRVSLKARYSMLKWYYSLFIETRGTGSVFRPLMFEFPNDQQLYDYKTIDWQFLLGKSLLCTPKVESGEPEVEAYFPIAEWFDLFSGRRVIGKRESNRVLTVETPFNTPAPQFIRGGHIISTQNVDKVLSTEDLDDTYELVVALDRPKEDGLLEARGSLMGIQDFGDDSVYYRCMEENCLYDIVVKVAREDTTSATLSVTINKQSQDTKTPLDDFGLSGLKLYGLPLEFAEEDERKVGYALLEVTQDDGSALFVPTMLKMDPIEKDAFKIDFESVVRVQDGYTMEIELYI